MYIHVHVHIHMFVYEIIYTNSEYILYSYQDIIILIFKPAFPMSYAHNHMIVIAISISVYSIPALSCSGICNLYSYVYSYNINIHMLITTINIILKIYVIFLNECQGRVIIRKPNSTIFSVSSEITFCSAIHNLNIYIRLMTEYEYDRIYCSETGFTKRYMK